jgi:hypothetical protein
VLIESPNTAQEQRVAAQAEIAAAKPNPWELSEAEVYAKVDSLGDIGASLTRADAARIQARLVRRCRRHGLWRTRPAQGVAGSNPPLTAAVVATLCRRSRGFSAFCFGWGRISPAVRQRCAAVSTGHSRVPSRCPSTALRADAQRVELARLAHVGQFSAAVHPSSAYDAEVAAGLPAVAHGSSCHAMSRTEVVQPTSLANSRTKARRDSDAHDAPCRKCVVGWPVRRTNRGWRPGKRRRAGQMP